MHHADPIIDNVRNKVIPSRTNSFHPPNDTAAMAAAVAEVDGGTRKEGSTHQLNTPGNHNGKKKPKKPKKSKKHHHLQDDIDDSENRNSSHAGILSRGTRGSRTLAIARSHMLKASMVLSELEKSKVVEERRCRFACGKWETFISFF
jgi:hypothetical protein